MRQVSLAMWALTLVGVLALQASAQDQPGAPAGPGGPEAGPAGPEGPGGPDGPGGDRPRFPLIQALDADGNGEISTEEIDNAAAALKTLDKNTDGKLTRDELRGGERVRGQGGDGERDGQGGNRRRGGQGGFRPPSPEEFATRALENDADGDGKLSKEELQKMAEKMAAQFGQRRGGGDRGGDRPEGDRPQGDRPQGDRPEGDRPQGDRPEGGPDRPGRPE